MKNKTDKQTEINSEHGVLKQITKIFGNIVFVAVIIIAAAVVFFLVQGKLSGGTPTIAGYKLYVVLSGSMEPELHTGSIAIVKPVITDTLAVKDIITFKSSDGSDKLITHRIVAITIDKQTSYTTKGDANDVNDPAVIPAADVIGKLSFSIPYVGYLMDFARTRNGLLFLVIIPGMFIIILEIKNLLKYAVLLDRKKRESKQAETEKRVAEIKQDDVLKGGFVEKYSLLKSSMCQLPDNGQLTKCKE